MMSTKGCVKIMAKGGNGTGDHRCTLFILSPWMSREVARLAALAALFRDAAWASVGSMAFSGCLAGIGVGGCTIATTTRFLP